MLRKILKRGSLIISVVLCLTSIGVPVCADRITYEEPYNFNSILSDYPTATVTNEFDLYCEMIQASDEELQRLGMTDEEIDELRRFDFRDALLERAQLSEEALINMGYTEEQTRLLKNYQGEILTPGNPVLAATSNCAGAITTNSIHNSEKIGARYVWAWDRAPTFAHTDSVAINWAAYTTNGTEIDVDVVSKSGKIFYSSVQTSTHVPEEDEDMQIVAKTAFSGYAADFPAGKAVQMMPDGTISLYSQSGYIDVVLKRNGTSPLSHVKAYGAYGHSYVSLTPGIDVSYDGLGFSFSPSLTVDTLGVARAKITSNGHVEPY